MPVAVGDRALSSGVGLLIVSVDVFFRLEPEGGEARGMGPAVFVGLGLLPYLC